jgi:hypothetical protein
MLASAERVGAVVRAGAMVLAGDMAANGDALRVAADRIVNAELAEDGIIAKVLHGIFLSPPMLPPQPALPVFQ